MEYRNGDEPSMAELDAALASGDTAIAPKATTPKAEESKPAVAMANKTEPGSEALVEHVSVEQLGAEALQGALAGMAKAAAPEEHDSKAIHDRRFAIETDHARDALLTDFGKDTLDDRDRKSVV